jgi:hypothetical protein
VERKDGWTVSVEVINVAVRDSLCVEVGDDGRGFDRADEPSGADGRGIRDARRSISRSSTSACPTATAATSSPT